VERSKKTSQKQAQGLLAKTLGKRGQKSSNVQAVRSAKRPATRRIASSLANGAGLH